MKSYRILVLTDHRGHSAENSIYSLIKTVRLHTQCAEIMVATRGDNNNHGFFYDLNSSKLQAAKVTEQFEFSKNGGFYFKNQQTVEVNIEQFDVILLRLPRPIESAFFDFLTALFPAQQILNNPIGIQETSTKEYLLNFPTVCPPMKMCRTIQDIHDFAAQFPIVLKPLENYGGKGIVKIVGDEVWEGNTSYSFEAYNDHFNTELNNGGYLAMKFLKNVDQGDKRVLVCNGEILGASLRLPAEGSWLCNIAQGGSSNYTEPDAAEQHIAKTIVPLLLQKGIVLFGFDTLVNDDGQRVLSEINTLSIGGLPQAERLSGRPIVQQAVDGIFKYLDNK